MSVVNYRGKRDEFRSFISVTEDGRRRRITEIVHGSKRDALARETQIKAELALETHVEASRQTVRQFERDWWSTKAASLSPTTAHRYRGLLDLHILAALGEIRIQKVRASHIAAIVRRLVEDEKHRTAKNVHVLVKQLFKAAMEAGLVVRNPVATVHAPNVVQREMTTLSPEAA